MYLARRARAYGEGLPAQPRDLPEYQQTACDGNKDGSGADLVPLLQGLGAGPTPIGQSESGSEARGPPPRTSPGPRVGFHPEPSADRGGRCGHEVQSHAAPARMRATWHHLHAGREVVATCPGGFSHASSALVIPSLAPLLAPPHSPPGRSRVRSEPEGSASEVGESEADSRVSDGARRRRAEARRSRSRVDPHEIEDAEDQLENYYVKVDGMVRRLLMIAEHIDANEDLVEIQVGGWVDVLDQLQPRKTGHAAFGPRCVALCFHGSGTDSVQQLPPAAH